MQNIMLKQQLTSQELQLLASEMDKRKKSTTTAWLLLIFLGGLGAHRYYLGKIGTGIAQTLTLGGLGVWTFIDLFLLSGILKKNNEVIEKEIIEELKLLRDSQKNDVTLNKEIN